MCAIRATGNSDLNKTLGCWMLIYVLYNRRLNIMLAKRPVAATSTTTIVVILIVIAVIVDMLWLFFLLCSFLSHIFPIIRTRYTKRSMHVCDPAPNAHINTYAHKGGRAVAAEAAATATRSHAWLSLIVKNRSSVQRQFRYGFFAQLSRT